MVTMKQIREFGHGIAREFQAERVILFGSYASGKPTKDSDVDILVILPFKGKPVYQSVKNAYEAPPVFPRRYHCPHTGERPKAPGNG